MAKTVSPEAFEKWGKLQHNARETWALVGRSAEDYQSGNIDAGEWSRRIRRSVDAQCELDAWRGQYLDRLGTLSR